MSRVYTEIVSKWDEAQRRYVTDWTQAKSYEYEGPVDLMCGAPSGLKNAAANMSDFFGTMVNQAKTVFGATSGVFKDLYNTFAPTVAAGPNQEGFSQAEKTAMETQVTEGTGAAYEHAAKALGEKQAAAGGGNVYIPKGQDEQMQEEVATKAAEQESQQRLGITEQNYAVGRQNYDFAAQALAGAPSVFNPATSAGGAATGAGEGAVGAENDVAQADNSFTNALVGGVMGVAGAAAGRKT